MIEICPACEKPIEPGQPRNGVSGEHWACYKARMPDVSKLNRYRAADEMQKKLLKMPSDRISKGPNYEGWWLNKRCRVVGSLSPFKLVTLVTWIGNPSHFSGVVQLTFEDGTTELVGGGRSAFGASAFKPRKSDVEVEDEDGGQ